MPNYSAHTTLNFIVGLPLVYYGFREQTLIERELVVIMSVSFLISTFFLSPDLDLRHSIPTKNWGFFRFIWIGYHKAFRHRGKSHSFLFSSSTKIFYLIFVGAGFFFSLLFLSEILAGADPKQAFVSSKDGIHRAGIFWFQKIIPYKRFLLAGIAGIAVSDWIHIFTDRVYSLAKKMKIN